MFYKDFYRYNTVSLTFKFRTNMERHLSTTEGLTESWPITGTCRPSPIFHVSKEKRSWRPWELYLSQSHNTSDGGSGLKLAFEII